MRRLVRHAVLALWLASSLSGCGGGGGASGITGPGGGGGGGTNLFRATIDGAAWTADALVSGQGALHTQPGFYQVQGIKASGSATSFVTLSLYNVDTVGTYPLGVSGTTFGGSATLGGGTSGWYTPLTGSAGSVTLTRIDDTRIAGTFAFTATPATGAATGVRTVTAGEFDYPVVTSGTGGPRPDGQGSRMSMKIGVQAWNAATVVSARTGSGAGMTTVIGGSNNTHSFSFSLSGTLPPGDYPLHNTTPIQMIIASTSTPVQNWGGSVTFDGTSLVTDDVGTITITDHTSTRLRGTFTATLAPSSSGSAPGPLSVSAGSFDIGLP